MEQYRLSAPQRLDATVELPASKSISNRALIIYALSGGSHLPENLSDCDDTKVIIKALNEMPEEIDIKAAGTAMRFMTAYLSVTGGTHVLTGTERMKHRPIGILVDALRLLGADIQYVGEEGFPPLRINGKQLEGGLLEIPGNVSSQYISALLMIGPTLKKGLTLRLQGSIFSRPYIDLTLWTMREFGAEADWSAADTITVNPKPYQDRPYYIENDWSGASYWYEIMSLTQDQDAEIRLSGLMDGSKQGDSVTRYIFSLLGVKNKFETKKVGIPQTVTVAKNGRCVPKLEYDFMALKTEMRKLGFVLKDANDSELIWDGERCEPDFEQGIDTYEDHRMALSMAPFACIHPGLIINNPQVVTKSYPRFWDDLREAGFTIEVKSV